MAHYTVSIEPTRKGNFQIRIKYPDGRRETAETIGKHDRLQIDGKWVAGRNLAEHIGEKCKQKYYSRKYDFPFTESKDTLSDTIEAYLNDQIVNNFSPRTVSHNEESLTAFQRENNLLTLAQANNADVIKEWKIKMHRRGLANETIRGRLANVGTFFKTLVERHKIMESPCWKGMLPKKKQNEPRYYTVAEYKALDEALAKIHPPTRLMCAMAHSLGCRLAELVNHAGAPVESDRIKWDDILWAKTGAELLIRKELTKTNKSRTLPMDAGVVALLGSRRTGSIIPFTRYQVYHYFRRARELAGINPDLDIHGLRHTFAKNYLQRGQGNLASLKALMGHASIVSTMIYAQFEKAYFREGIERAYEQRLVEENLAGRNAEGGVVAGLLQDDLGHSGEPSGLLRVHGTPTRIDEIEAKIHGKLKK